MPPTIHAAATGPVPNRCSWMVSPRTRPKAAAGMNARTQREEGAAPGRVAAGDALQHVDESTPVETDDREDRADLDDHGVRLGDVARRVGLADVEQLFGHGEVPGRADREVLGDPFDDAEHDRLRDRQLVRGGMVVPSPALARPRHAATTRPAARITPTTTAATRTRRGTGGASWFAWGATLPAPTHTAGNPLP